MINDGFTYDKNAEMNKIEKFGYEWYYRINTMDKQGDFFTYFNFRSEEFGDFNISRNALDSIKDEDQYKVLSLLYEQMLKNKEVNYSITLENEKDKLRYKYDYQYISLSIDEFLDRFPSDIIEIQQRSLISLYNQYPDYGQEIDRLNHYMFFSKNTDELFFILNAMSDKRWIDVKIERMIGGDFILSNPLVINEEGWLEIERTIKKSIKKQVFIAMKFKDMDAIHNSIHKAIVDATFTPLRIDKKEHINQISSEIQYEISQSGLVVADVTGQNQGVYYEAGYAMGLNIPVIWTCKEGEENDVHFDTRQYNTIFWEDENDLYERLKKRIEAIMGLREKG
jgi:nucleoside 2-deoxyribosyltransferase